jgi:hypothetical protein
MLSSNQMINSILHPDDNINGVFCQMIHLILSKPDIAPIQKENVIIPPDDSIYVIIQPDDSIYAIIQQDDTTNIYVNVIIQPNDNIIYPAM